MLKKLDAKLLESVEAKYNRKNIEWVSVSQVKIVATSDVPAKFTLDGLYGGKDLGHVKAGSSGEEVENTADDVMDITTDVDTGLEHPSNWYGIFAIKSGSNFILKAATFIRVKLDSANKVLTGLHTNPGADANYSWVADAYNDSKILVITGSKRGTLRNVTDSGTVGSNSFIDYDGASLGLVNGDCIMISPAGATNFRYVGSIYNDGSSNIRSFVCRDGLYLYGNVTVLLNNSNPIVFTALDVIASSSMCPVGYMIGGFWRKDAGGNNLLVSSDGITDPFYHLANNGVFTNVLVVKDAVISGVNTRVIYAGVPSSADYASIFPTSYRE